MTVEDLVRLRRARDRMDRDYANPLDVPALARVALMSPGHFSRSFRAAFGETPLVGKSPSSYRARGHDEGAAIPPCVAKIHTRPVRNGEAQPAPAGSVKRMDIKLSQCFIAVDDHDKALAFYRDVLGLEVRNDVAFEGMRWVTVGVPSQPDVDIVLEPPVADPNASPADREAAASLLAKGLLRGVVFATDDCDATFERIRAAGGEVLQEPMDQFYGVRDCAFRDPSGNMLRFSQPRGQ